MRHIIPQTVLFSVLFIILPASLKADYIRYISSREGISNNSVLSISQDKAGYIWVGTCEGLDNWNGLRMFRYPEDGSGHTPISGNLIEEIIHLDSDRMWIRTNYGLDVMEDGDIVESHTEFQGMYRTSADESGRAITLTQQDSLYLYEPETRTFRKIEKPDGLHYAGVKELQIYGNTVWAYTSDGILKYETCRTSDGYRLDLLPHKCDKISGIINARHKDGATFLVDKDGILWSFGQNSTGQAEYIADISELIGQRGTISDIERLGEDFYISFLFNGVVSLRYDASIPDKYTVHSLPISCGVFSLFKDRYQDIIWIGTDGQGLAMYAKDNIDFRSYGLTDLPYRISMPIRAINIDKTGALWLGTKGDGIMRLENFDPDGTPAYTNASLFREKETPLSSSTVFAIENSHRDLVWIGTEGNGINWWSFADRKMHSLEGKVDKTLQYTHAIHESDRNTLWVATVGRGVFRIDLDPASETPIAMKCTKLPLDSIVGSNEFFFTLAEDSNGDILLGNRGAGLIRYRPSDSTAYKYGIPSDKNLLLNDVWSILRTRDGFLLAGTSYGAVQIDETNGEMTDSIPFRKIVHGMVENLDGIVWMSTNSGLVRLGRQPGKIISYGHSYGLSTLEYSDGATFYDREHDAIYFGGTNGFTIITKNKEYTDTTAWNPSLTFRSARIEKGGETSTVNISTPKGNARIRIKPKYHLNSIEVDALDYINSENLKFWYSMGNNRATWQETPNSIRLADLGRGRYRLNVRYTNESTGYTSPASHIIIRLRAPWYLSNFMQCCYALTAIALTFILIRLRSRERHRKRKQQSDLREARHKQELFNEQVHIYENLAQELSIPLTLISAPCQMIMEHTGSDGFIKQNGEKILTQSARLRNMLRTFLSFRESRDSDKTINVTVFSASDLADNLHDEMSHILESQGIILNITAKDGLTWSSDLRILMSAIDGILHLFQNHAKKGNFIKMDISAADDRLRISVSGDIPLSAGEFQGILSESHQADKPNLSSGLTMQEEILLVNCRNYLRQIDGDLFMTDSSEARTLYTEIPKLSVTAEGYQADGIKTDTDKQYLSPSSGENTPKTYETRENRSMVYIIGRAMEVLNTVADLLDSEYNIRVLETAYAEVALNSDTPDLIIYENIDMSIDGLAECTRIHTDGKFSHIPLIMLTTMRQADIHVAEIERCADICTTMPFNIDHLKSEVRQLIERQNSLQSYYHSSVSAYSFSGGRILHREDKSFLEKMTGIINREISNSGLSISFIAKEMGISTSGLYHRLANIVEIRPSNIIREYRLLYAENLLKTTRLSIDEILYRSGYTNRGTFFKNFSEKFGMTPSAYRKKHLEQLG